VIAGAPTQSTGFDPAATRPLRRSVASNSSISVSQLGVGCAPFGSLAPGTSGRHVHQAFTALYDAGLRYFDVAPLYGVGLAEHRLGACMRHVDRRTIVLSTKVGRLLDAQPGAAAAGASGGTYPFSYHYDYSHDATLRSLEHSLQRIGTNAIDIALIHDVNRRWQGDLLEQRYAEAMNGAYRALHSLRAAGVLKAIGVGVNDWSILERFAADGDFDCFMLAGRYTLLDHTALDTFMPDCARRGIGVLMAAPFNSGILATGVRPGATYFYQPAEADIMARVTRIEGVCARHGVNIAAAALQFPLAHPAVASVVTGMGNPREVAENLAHCRATIPGAFWDEMKHEGLIAANAPVPAGP
jgi:D-threo-aldose 1-dehydrogenase